MELTKKYKTDLAKAMRCAESGKAYHWPTIAAILAAEIKRLGGVYHWPGPIEKGGVNYGPTHWRNSSIP